MDEAILDALGAALTRWTMGGSAVLAAPPAWRNMLGGDAGEAELRLVALSGQYLGAFVLPEPAGEISARPDIPILPLPPLPDALRPRTRRLLQQLREPALRRALLEFLDGRGWTLHPGDWMPAPNEDAPAAYAAWQDWASTSRGPPPAPEALTAESWDDLGPAARHAAFRTLRRQDPMRAAALLEEKIGHETADGRVRLVEALGIGLSDADRPLLEGLAADRAPRVKALASTLLARLGHGQDGGEDLAELAGFFSVQTKGLLRRSRVIAFQASRTEAQRNRRHALMEASSIGGLAKALELSPEDLIAAWPWGGESMADQALAAMACRSGSDEVIATIVETLTSDTALDARAPLPLLPRLTPAQRSRTAAWMLREKGAAFLHVLPIAGGDGRLDAVMRTAAGAALLTALDAQDANPNAVSHELAALGLLASRQAARDALSQLAAAGLIASDPRLDMLRLNAALEDRSDARSGMARRGME
jgi:hypothetical protein